MTWSGPYYFPIAMLTCIRQFIDDHCGNPAEIRRFPGYPTLDLITVRHCDVDLFTQMVSVCGQNAPL